MTDEEIRTLYRDAKDKREEIFILSQLTCRRVRDIAFIVSDIDVKSDGITRMYNGRKYDDYGIMMREVIRDITTGSTTTYKRNNIDSCKKDKYNDEFSKRLARLMKRSNVTKASLTNQLGAGESTVETWLHGSTPRLFYVPMIAHVLGCSLEELIISDEGGI